MTFDEWREKRDPMHDFDWPGIDWAREAWNAGRRAMRDEIIAKLGTFEANKCAQIAASVEVGDEG